MKIYKWTIAVVFSLFISNANAASLSLSPSGQTVSQNSSFLVELWMDFSTEATVGGGLQLTFDPTLVAFQTFNWEAAFPKDAGLSDWSITAPNVVEVGFGNFGGISGPALVGTFDFSSLLVDGIASFSLTAGGTYGPFVSAVSYMPLNTVSVAGANVDISSVSAVPLPAAVWLFLSGLGFFGFSRRKIA